MLSMSHHRFQAWASGFLAAAILGGCAPALNSDAPATVGEQGQMESPERPSGAAVNAMSRLTAKLVVDKLDFPIAWAPAADGRIYFTEGYTGRIRFMKDWAVAPEPVAQMPDSVGTGEQAMVGLAAHPNFLAEPYLYLYYTARQSADGSKQTVNRLLRIWVEDGVAREQKVLLDDLPSGAYHNGGILVFGPDGKLYVSVGDGHRSESAQDLNLPSGKILRLNPDGSVPEDNPFRGSPVYALGMRNVFGMAFDPVSGNLYTTENGPQCCDEVNLVKPGRNYGWPHALGLSGGDEYDRPLLVFTPSIAPTQAVFYTGDLLPLKNQMLFGDFLTGSVRRLALDGPGRDRVLVEEPILRADGPVIAVFQGPDRHLYFSTTSALFRLTPAAPEASR